MSLPVIGISIPHPPQETGRMSLSTVHFPLVIKQDTLHNHVVCWTDAKCQMYKLKMSIVHKLFSCLEQELCKNPLAPLTVDMCFCLVFWKEKDQTGQFMT